ncbi:hypothetical protein C5167_026009 [Papaver somniferum]|nr:hypothetical protein C5167_026009 [Papaver somniferum]
MEDQDVSVLAVAATSSSREKLAKGEKKLMEDVDQHSPLLWGIDANGNPSTGSDDLLIDPSILPVVLNYRPWDFHWPDMQKEMEKEAASP